MCTDHSGPFCTQVLPKTLLPNSPKRSLAEGKDGPSRPAAVPAFTAALLSAAPALQPPHIPSWPIPTHRSPVSLRSRQCLTPSPACSARLPALSSCPALSRELPGPPRCSPGCAAQWIGPGSHRTAPSALATPCSHISYRIHFTASCPALLHFPPLSQHRRKRTCFGLEKQFKLRLGKNNSNNLP